MSGNIKLKEFAVELFKIDAIKFGEYKTKVGLMTPVYCDLRVIVSYPKLLDTLADLIIERLNELGKIDVICGVPYTALPIATAVSIKTGVPMVMRRKESKEYGTKKLIEGTFKEGDECLIVEDIVTSGSSILETVKDLIGAGLKCSQTIVLLNREQGGEAILKENGMKMHALLTLTQLINYLKEANCIDDSIVDKVKEYVIKTQVTSEILNIATVRTKLSYSERAQYAKNVVAARLFRLMNDKQTNLCVAADLTNATDLLNLAEQVGPHICLFKTHIDIVEDFHPNILKHLKDIAKKHNFILFEDRKFADIGKTVELQYSKGVYKISSWANLVTAHSVIGKGVLDALKQAGSDREFGVFLLAETSAAGNLIDDKYTKSTLKLVDECPDVIAGVVCQNPLFLNKPGLVQLTPGVQIGVIGDNLGQQYNSPEIVVSERGADVAVVGRGITQSPEPEAAAKKYKGLLWGAYTKRINQL